MFETRAPSATFHHIGDTCEGEIVDVRRTQATEWKTNIPYYWQDKKVVTNAVNPYTQQANDPKLQYEITLDTGRPDENGETERRIYVDNKRKQDALKAAVRQAGGRDGLLIGGYLKAEHTGTEDTGAGSPAKLYAYTYRPPAAGEGRKPDLTPVLYGGAEAPTPTTAYATGGMHAERRAMQNITPGTPAADVIREPVPQRSAAQTFLDDEPPF